MLGTLDSCAKVVARLGGGGGAAHWATQPREVDPSLPVRMPILDRYKDAGKVFVIGKCQCCWGWLCALLRSRCCQWTAVP